MKTKCARFFVTWPPPHRVPATKGMSKRDDRRNWYWSVTKRDWQEYLLDGTGFATREEAERAALAVAAVRSELAPNAEHLGQIKVTRQIVRINGVFGPL